MRKGENIFKRKDGRWEARYIKGYDSSNKIKYGYCYGKSYSDAKDKVTKIKAALLTDKPITQVIPKHRFNYYCDEWFKSRKNNIRESTYIKYEIIINKHIKPKLGSYKPIEINTNVVDEYIDKLIKEDNLSIKTVKDILVILRSILKYCNTQFPNTFSIIEIHYPKENKKKIRVLSKDEQNQFISYLLKDDDNCKFGILLMLLSGIRIGELCALKWGDVNLKEQCISINSTLQRLHNYNNEDYNRTHIVIGATKTDTSIRIIPLNSYAFDLCQKYFVDNVDAFILTGTTKYMEPRTLQYRLKKYTDECNLEGVHAHTLRHTFATRAVEVGFEIKSLSEVLGHANTNITLQRYVHSSMELKRANMDKLNDVIKKH